MIPDSQPQNLYTIADGVVGSGQQLQFLWRALTDPVLINQFLHLVAVCGEKGRPRCLPNVPEALLDQAGGRVEGHIVILTIREAITDGGIGGGEQLTLTLDPVGIHQTLK